MGNEKFINYFGNFAELDDNHNSRQANIDILKKLKKKWKNNKSTAGEAKLYMIKDALATFTNDLKYSNFISDYKDYKLSLLVESALLGDNEVSHPEMESIVKEGMKFGNTETEIRKIIKSIVLEKKGKILRKEDSPPTYKPPVKTASKNTNANQQPPVSGKSKSDRRSSEKGLTPIIAANIASGIAASIAFMYLVVLKGGVHLGWFGGIVFCIAAIISVKNAKNPAKRHSWALIAAALMYFMNFGLFLMLLPVFGIWHWSPFIFSRVNDRSSIIWLLPLIICIGTYGSVEAIQRSQRNQPIQNHVLAEKARAERAQAAKVQAEKDRAEKDRAERIKAEKERAEKARLEKERMERIKAEKALADRVQADKIRAEKAREDRVRLEKAQVYVAQLEKELAEKEQAEKLANSKKNQKAKEKKKDVKRTNQINRDGAKEKYVWSPLDATVSLEENIYATSGPQKVKMKLRTGDTLFIKVMNEEAEIQWMEGVLPVGPEGTNYLAKTQNGSSKFLCPNATCGSIIGRIGENGEWFEVGQSTALIARSNGVLFLAINDKINEFDDNFGMFRVFIYKGSIPH